MSQPPLASLLAPGAKARNLDLNALLAIAQHEGASGGIGDGGHAFGPFQLNNAGGVITGKFGGQTPQQINQWAWSPTGINYALDGISKVASGQHGEQAVRSIASKFERPANVNAEIQDALAHLGKNGASTPPVFSGSSPTPSAAARPESNPLLGQLIAQTNEMVGLGSNPSLAGLLSGPANAALSPHPGSGATVGGKAGQGQSGLPPVKGKGGLAELLREGTGGPTHSTGNHVHLATRDAQSMLAALEEGKRLGLTELENPYVDPVNASVHAPHSFHKQNFPGLYNGRQLGEATDFSGSPAAMDAIYKWAQTKLGGRH
jgi:hypothetical protein